MKTVFDTANDDAPNFIIPTEIPAEKAAVRLFLESKGVGASVSLSVACANSNLPLDRGWRAETAEPPAPNEWKPSERKPANTNRKLMSWPLLAYLQRQGRHEDAELVERYRGLVALMELEPLQGQEPTRSDGLWIESRSSITDADIDEASEADWPGGKVPGGDLAHKGERQLAKAPGTSSQARPTNEDTVVVMRSMDMRFNERALIAQIDMRGVLERLRAAMGPVTAPFEDAVLVGATFGQIGEVRNFKGKQAEAVGKALVMMGLDAVINEWALIGYERRKAEEQAERNVERRRAELAAQREAYLRRAA